MRKRLTVYLIVLLFLMAGCANDNNGNGLYIQPIEEVEYAPNEQSTDVLENKQNEWQLRISETIDSMDNIKETTIAVNDSKKTITVAVTVLNTEQLTDEEIQSIIDLVKNSTESEYKVVVATK